MSHSINIDADDVIALLRPEAVVAACGLDAKERGRAWRLRTCPACGEKPSRSGSAIYRRRRDQMWRWTHHGHDCGGDLLDLIAAADGIERRREFPQLLVRAAQIAGLEAGDPGIEQRIAERRRVEEAERRVDDAKRESAIARMPATWDALDRRSFVGEHYLAGRGIDPAELRSVGDVVRYTTAGEVAVPLRDFDTGAICGIQYRAPRGKGFRMEPFSDPTCSALHGRLVDLDPGGPDVAVLVEGLADTLAAVLAFPGCAVYGAAGAAHVEGIAVEVAPRVLECRGWLLMCPDDDETSADNYGPAIRAAKGAGLGLVPLGAESLDGINTIRLVDLGEHHDLADAWRAGWSPSWPTRTR